MTAALTKIMVATDFSPTSKEALEYGRMLAERVGASLHLLHVCEQPAMAAAWSEGYSMTITDLQEALKKVATDRIASLIVPSWTVPVTTEVVCGLPAQMIVEVARARGVSLIVMGTHGYSGINHLLLGSIAERVVRTASCPVLTVRGAEEPAIRRSVPSVLATAV